MIKRKLETLDKISILEHSKDKCPKGIALETGFSKSTVNFYRRFYRVNEHTEHNLIDRIINQILIDDGNEIIDYNKQNNCKPKTFYFHCHTCKFSAGENNKQGIIEHISRHEDKPSKNITEQMI